VDKGSRVRSPGSLGWAAALLAAFLCASAFVATARAEDPPAPPPASTGAPLDTGTPPTTTENPGASTGTSEPPATTENPGASTGTSEPPATTENPGASTGTSEPPATTENPGASTGTSEPPAAVNGSTDSAPAASASAPLDRDEATIVLISGLAPSTGAPEVIPLTVECQVIAVCGLVPVTRAPSDSERALVEVLPAAQTQRDAQPGAGSSRPDGAQPPRSPLPSAPDHQPQGPSAPVSLLGSSSSGGSHSGAVLGLLAALLGLTAFESSRLVTPFERRRRALLLVFSLERPG
jgi:hypothetical protein